MAASGISQFLFKVGLLPAMQQMSAIQLQLPCASLMLQNIASITTRWLCGSAKQSGRGWTVMALKSRCDPSWKGSPEVRRCSRCGHGLVKIDRRETGIIEWKKSIIIYNDRWLRSSGDQSWDTSRLAPSLGFGPSPAAPLPLPIWGEPLETFTENELALFGGWVCRFRHVTRLSFLIDGNGLTGWFDDRFEDIDVRNWKFLMTQGWARKLKLDWAGQWEWLDDWFPWIGIWY